MKRFFKPVEKEGSSKKPSLSQPEKEEDVSLSNENKGEPSKFMTWNANSFLLRVKNNWPEFTKLVTSFDPDVIAIQVTLLQFLYSLFWCTPFENSVFLVDSMCLCGNLMNIDKMNEWQVGFFYIWKNWWMYVLEHCI